MLESCCTSHVLQELAHEFLIMSCQFGDVWEWENGSCAAASSMLVWCPWKRSISDSSQTSISPLPSSSNFLKVAFPNLHTLRTIPLLVWRSVRVASIWDQSAKFPSAYTLLSSLPYTSCFAQGQNLPRPEDHSY